MKRKVLVLTSIVIIVLVSACGPAPTPTLSAGDVANTAVANAWVMLTLTQAAMPTATVTPLPTATFTPEPPTFTPMPFPTQEPLNLVVPTATSECNQVPPLKPQGKLVHVEFSNLSEGSVNFSFGMNSPNTHGECVTYGYVFGKNQKISTDVLAGCYWAYGWVTGAGNTTSTAKGVALMCMDATNVIYHVSIGKEAVSVK